jgi:hypothetical protein
MVTFILAWYCLTSCSAFSAAFSAAFFASCAFCFHSFADAIAASFAALLFFLYSASNLFLSLAF